MLLFRLIFKTRNISPWRGIKTSAATIAAALCCCSFSSSHAKEGGWDLETYHVQLIVAIDAPGGVQEQLASELPEYVRDRIEASLTPAWACDLSLAIGAQRAQLYANLSAQTEPLPAKLPVDIDKL